MQVNRTEMANTNIPTKIWSFAALDAMDKVNYLPVKRECEMQASPHGILRQAGINLEDNGGSK